MAAPPDLPDPDWSPAFSQLLKLHRDAMQMIDQLEARRGGASVAEITALGRAYEDACRRDWALLVPGERLRAQILQQAFRVLRIKAALTKR